MSSGATEQYLKVRMEGDIACVTLARPEKRNALNNAFARRLGEVFEELPENAKAAIIDGEGAHFCAGLDLSSLTETTAAEGMMLSRIWYAAFDKIQFGRVPVIAVMHGAVVGGGLELAATCHVRVADETAYYGLPEGQRGIFVGGSGAVRIPKIIGPSRMSEMMLTGRVYNATDGQQLGLSHYLVPKGEAFAKAMELARKIATNAPLSNFAIMHAIPRIAEQSADQGLFTEALMAAISQGDPAAKTRLRDFLEKRAGKVTPTD